MRYISNQHINTFLGTSQGQVCISESDLPSVPASLVHCLSTQCIDEDHPSIKVFLTAPYYNSRLAYDMRW